MSLKCIILLGSIDVELANNGAFFGGSFTFEPVVDETEGDKSAGMDESSQRSSAICRS